MIGRIIQQLDGLADRIGKLDHARQKLSAPPTTLWTIIHFALECGDFGLVLLLSPIPLGCKDIDNTVTRFVGTAKDHGQLSALFIHNTARGVFLLATQIMI
jgi:hypothetical protein